MFIFGLPKLLPLPHDLVSPKLLARSVYAGEMKPRERRRHKEDVLGSNMPASPLSSGYGHSRLIGIARATTHGWGVGPAACCTHYFSSPAKGPGLKPRETSGERDRRRPHSDPGAATKCSACASRGRCGPFRARKSCGLPGTFPPCPKRRPKPQPGS